MHVDFVLSDGSKAKGVHATKNGKYRARLLMDCVQAGDDSNPRRFQFDVHPYSPDREHLKAMMNSAVWLLTSGRAGDEHYYAGPRRATISSLNPKVSEVASKVVSSQRASSMHSVQQSQPALPSTVLLHGHAAVPCCISGSVLLHRPGGALLCMCCVHVCLLQCSSALGGFMAQSKAVNGLAYMLD